MKEDVIEAHLIKRVEEAGGFTRKVIYQGRRGAPDRHCYLPGGRLVIVECKRPEGGELSALQVREIKRLKRLGFDVHVVDTKEQIDELI